jgi:hypothetical protein
MGINRITLFIFVLMAVKTKAQNRLPLPLKAEAGRVYAQCLLPDSIYAKEKHEGPIPPLGWEEFLLETTPKIQSWTLELPIFDTILITIPVDKTTRMANLPDEYGLTKGRVLIKEASTKWVFKRMMSKVCLSANPDNCLIMALYEVPPEYITVQKLVVKATAHQRRYDGMDTVVFKQVIETKPLKKTVIEVPPQYEKVFRKTHPHTYYSEWREVLCTNSDWSPTVRQIQTALKNRGYDPGAFDDIFGAKTKAAITRFQKDNKLPMGNLNCETLKALGLSCN